MPLAILNKVVDSHLVNRKPTGVDKKNSNGKTKKTTSNETNNKKSTKSTKSTKTTNKSSKKWLSITSIILLCTLSSLLLFFYYVPWEKWIFSEQELENLLYSYNTQEEYYEFMATTDQHFEELSIHEVKCFDRGYWRERKLNVTPARCGTVITDEFLSKEQIFKLRNLAIKLINKIGDTSYANRESINLQWLNLHNLFRRNTIKKVLSKREFELIQNASIAARRFASEAFGIPEHQLYYNMVSQFTRYRPLVRFSEFKHVDKVRSPALIITSILWLSTHNVDFGGGYLEFLTGPGPKPFSSLFLEPKMGRFAAWTSGYENPHGVGELYWGNRLALIFAFTVSDKLGYPSIQALKTWAENGTTPTSSY